MKKRKIEPWRIIVFIIGVIFIIYLFLSKNNDADVALSAEQALPALITNIAVTVVKFVIIAGVVFLGKFVIGKIKNNKKE